MYWKYRVALIFCGSKVSQILRILNHSQNYFSKNFDTSKLSHNVRNGLTVSISTSSSKVDWYYPGTILLGPQGELLKEVPLSLIFEASTKIEAVLQSSTAGMKVARRAYLQISTEKEAKIGQCTAELRFGTVLCYGASSTSHYIIAGLAYWAASIREIVSM